MHTLSVPSAARALSRAFAVLVLLPALAGLQGCAPEGASALPDEGAPAARQPADPSAETAPAPHITAASPGEAGRYLVLVGGCNDCHTDGWLQTEGDVPESAWLTGSSLGWRGPWGTTYPANLRLTASRLDAEAWVDLLRTRKALPPMPWMNVSRMSEQDMRAIWTWLREMGPAGEPVPAALPPDVDPTTPYFSLVPIVPTGTAPATQQ